MFYLLLFLFFFHPLFADPPVEKSFAIVVPSFNNEDWCLQNLSSILSQNYPHFRLIYIDDASTDATYQLIKNYITLSNPSPPITLIHNETRLGALANTYNAIWMCDPSEIIVIVDGDDWLAHEGVLSHLNTVYSDPDVWVSYGQFIEYPSGFLGGARLVPQEIIQQNRFRDHDWTTSHLRSFYAALFQKIEKTDLFYEDTFFSVTADLAAMFPILEMAGSHSRFIPDILYVYNVANPINDRKLHLEKQQLFERIIRSKKRYEPLPSLDSENFRTSSK